MPTIYKTKKETKKPEGNEYYNERRRIYDSARWRRLSRLKLRQCPLCELCKERGAITPAEDVHHIVPFMEGKDSVERNSLAYSYENLLSLCKKCHQSIHNSRADGDVRH